MCVDVCVCVCVCMCVSKQCPPSSAPTVQKRRGWGQLLNGMVGEAVMQYEG